MAIFTTVVLLNSNAKRLPNFCPCITEKSPSEDGPDLFPSMEGWSRESGTGWFPGVFLSLKTAKRDEHPTKDILRLSVMPTTPL